MRLIDADALIKEFLNGCRTEFEILNKCLASENVLSIIQNAPTVDAIPNKEGYEMYNKGYMSGYERGKEDRPQGEWIYRNYNWWCSICGEQPKTMGYVGTAKFMHDEFKFCNHCGAKMTGGVIMIDGADMRGGRE